MDDFYIISNYSITRDFTCEDGLHLNKDGTYVLAGKFVNFINSINNF